MQKIRRTAFLLGIILLALQAKAQNNFSAHSKYVFHKLKPYIGTDYIKPIPQNLIDECLIHNHIDGQVAEKQNTLYLSGILLADEKILTPQKLNAIGVTLNSQIGDVWTFRLPLHSLYSFANLKGVKYVELDHKIYPCLDKARADIKADEVHNGMGLRQAYKGKGVILGILDSGFDTQHITFTDSDNKSRIIRWWAQSQNGKKPKDFAYGSELITEKEIFDAARFEQGIGHGTHVAGIAGGRGEGTGTKYMGIAPDSDLLFVSYKDAGSTIVDGVKYIFDYATEQGKPAVINMSLGTHIGPHDGTGLVDKSFEGLVGKGKILVGALGNEGQIPMHYSHDFSNDTVKIIPLLGGAGTIGQTTVEIWGPKNDDEFSVKLILLDTEGKPYNDFTKVYTPQTGYDSTGIMQGFGQMSIVATSAQTTVTPNQKGNIQIKVFNLFTPLQPALEIIAKTGKVHVWNLGFGTSGAAIADTLLGGIPVDGYQAGDFESSLREIGGVSNAVISVGAYTTTNEYIDASGKKQNINVYGTIGDRAGFSSYGPTADGRVKPDIAAPGNVIASAFSRFDQQTVMPANTVANIKIDTKTHKFGVYEGTSMASPMVAGAVALMLEANPNLTTEDCKQLLKKTARLDQFTGQIPTEGSNIWGAGKLNMVELLKSTEATDRTAIQAKNHDLRISNLNNEYIKIESFNSNLLQIQVIDLTGRTLLQTDIRPNTEIHVPTHTLGNGVYIINCYQNKELIKNQKLFIVR